MDNVQDEMSLVEQRLLLNIAARTAAFSMWYESSGVYYCTHCSLEVDRALVDAALQAEPILRPGWLVYCSDGTVNYAGSLEALMDNPMYHDPRCAYRLACEFFDITGRSLADGVLDAEPTNEVLGLSKAQDK